MKLYNIKPEQKFSKRLQELNKRFKILSKPREKQSNGFQKFRQLKFDKEFTKHYVKLYKDKMTLESSDKIMKNIED